MIINPISKSTIKSPNAYTMNTLTPFSTRNTQSNSNVNIVPHTVATPNPNSGNLSPRKLATPHKVSSAIAHNVYNSEYIHDAIHKGKILPNSHSPYSRKSNPNNTPSGVTQASNNKSTNQKRSDHILIKEKLMQRGEELHFDNHGKLNSSTPNPLNKKLLNNFIGTPGKNNHTQFVSNHYASQQFLNPNIGTAPTKTGGNSAKNTLKQNLQLLKEEHETDNELSEHEHVNKGSVGVVHYTNGGLNTNIQGNHLPSTVMKSQNLKEQDPKKLFSKK